MRYIHCLKFAWRLKYIHPGKEASCHVTCFLASQNRTITSFSSWIYFNLHTHTFDICNWQVDQYYISECIIAHLLNKLGPIQESSLRLRSRPADSKSHHHGVSPSILSTKWSPWLDWCWCRCSNSWVATKQVPRDLTISFGCKVSHARRRLSKIVCICNNWMWTPNL